jgi:hypothetical protein
MYAKAYSTYQLVCRYIVNAGLIVFAQDPFGQGERYSYYEKKLGGPAITYCCPDHDYAGNQCLATGDCIAKYMVHDIMRGIDYLCTRPEVDTQKIGITGSSGGGLQTTMMMMCEPRIAAAAPCSFLTDRESWIRVGAVSDAEQVWPGLTAKLWDYEDALIAMVPRPVRVLAAKYDVFPIEGTRRIVENSKRHWQIYDSEKNIDIVEDAVEHMYSRNLAKAAAEFFAYHFLGRKKVLFDDNKVNAIESNLLWCTKKGQIRETFDDARFVFEENLSVLKKIKKQQKQENSKKRRQKTISWLRKKVLDNRQKCDCNLRIYTKTQLNELIVEVGLWRSQEDIFNFGILFRNFAYADKELPVTVALWQDGTVKINEYFKWIQSECANRRAVMVLDVTASGALLPHRLISLFEQNERNGSIRKLCDDLIWLDDSLAAIRVYDVIRACDVLQEWPGIKVGDVSFYANGMEKMYIKLASMLDKRIKYIGDIAELTEWVSSRYYDSNRMPEYIIPSLLKYI